MAFLESMGLPKSKLKATKKEVEGGKLSFKDSLEYKMYSRHDQPADVIDSDMSPVLEKENPANK